MNFSNAKIRAVVISDEKLTVELQDGRAITVPLIWFPTLVQATAAQQKNWKTCEAGAGIHWPSLDYHLSVEGLLRGAREAEGITRLLLARA
mgnify:CR=1 FL=1